MRTHIYKYKHNTGFCGIPLRDKCGLPWTLIASNFNFPRRNWHIRCVMVIVHVQRFFRSFSGRLDPFSVVSVEGRGRLLDLLQHLQLQPGLTNVYIFHAGKNDVK